MTDLPASCDAVVIGAGHNGLVAANVLADAGWDVVVLEAQDQPGGAVRSAEVTAPGFTNDLFSAFYPLAAASPAIQALDLGAHGLTWVHAPAVLGHPTEDGPSAVLSTDVEETATSLGAFAPGDAAAWRELYDGWLRVGPRFLDALLGPFPPVRAGARLAALLGPAGIRSMARLSLLPMRRLGQETFAGEGGRLLLAGGALHTDIGVDSAGSGLFGWILACLGQQVGYPVPQGGAQALTTALVTRLRRAGGELVVGAPVARVAVAGGRARGVVTAGGAQVRARRAVLADVLAPDLLTRLVGEGHLPAPVRRSLARFDPGHATVKVDWALDGPIPWQEPALARTGCVHLGPSMGALSRYAAELADDQIPADPFVVLGQMTTTDPTRSPAGTESAWAYTHVPQRARCDAGGELGTGWSPDDVAGFTARIEAVLERHAPGFRSRVLARHVMAPADLEAANANLAGGAINAGTAQLHQQLVFRPYEGWGRPETPVAGLYLASASAHPGGGVHGAPGANAARAALARHRRRWWAAGTALGAAAVGVGARPRWRH